MFYAYDYNIDKIYNVPFKVLSPGILYSAYDNDTGNCIGEISHLGAFRRKGTDKPYRIPIFDSMEELRRSLYYKNYAAPEKEQPDAVLEWLNQEMKANAAIDVEFSKNLPVYMDLMYERLSQLQKNEYEFDEPGYYLRVTVTDLCNGTLSGNIVATSTPSEQGVQAIDNLTEERVRAIAQEEMRKVFIRFLESCAQLKEQIFPEAATHKHLVDYMLSSMPLRLVDSIKK